MSGQGNRDQVAAELYRAVAEGSGVVVGMRGLARRLGASSHAVHLMELRDGQPRSAAARGEGGLPPSELAAYARQWLPRDPWAQAGARLPPGVHNMERVVPADRLRRSPVWNEWGRPRDAAFHAMAVVLRSGGGAAGMVCFHRRARDEAFGPREEAMLAALAPDLAAAAAMELRLSDAEAALRGALDALPDGMAVLDRAGRLVFANAALERIAARRDGLDLAPQGGVTSPDAKARTALARAVLAAQSALDGRIGLLPDASRVALPRRGGAAPWVVEATPLRRASLALVPEGFEGVLLLVRDPAGQAAPRAPMLRAAFGLTEAEAALAAALARGVALPAYAERRGVTLGTLRGQLAAIRRKTACADGAALAALLARLGR